MSERKGSLQLVSNISAKLFPQQSNENDIYNNSDHSKTHKYRGSYGNLDENSYFAISKQIKPETSFTKK